MVGKYVKFSMPDGLGGYLTSASKATPLLELSMATAMPDRKPLAATPASMLDILEAATHIWSESEYDGREEQTARPCTIAEECQYQTLTDEDKAH
jgi:hypothetical protein